MKPISLLVAPPATSSFAHLPGFPGAAAGLSSSGPSGIRSGEGFAVPVPWPSCGVDTKPGLGSRPIPGVQAPLADRFDLCGFAGCGFTTWSDRQEDSDGSIDGFSERSSFPAMGLPGRRGFPRRSSFVSLDPVPGRRISSSSELPVGSRVPLVPILEDAGSVVSPHQTDVNLRFTVP